MKAFTKKMKSYSPYAFALAGGAILPFSLAPYYFGIASFFSCAAFLWALNRQSAKKGFVLGLLYGLASFGLGASWVYVSIHDFGGADPWLACFITSLFILFISLYPAALGAIINRFFKANNYIRYLLAFPALWVALDLLRGWFLTGFPWLFLGYSQMGTHLRAFAPIGGVWMVTWVTALVGSLLFCILDYFYQNEGNTKRRNILFGAMIAVWLVAFGVDQIQWVQSTDKKLDVALVQGNIAQMMRWDPKAVSNIVQTYETLTNEALNTDLIIWPEAAIPVPLPQSTSLFQTMDALTKEHHNALFAGVPTQLPDQQHYYNSLLGVGLASGVYHKTHLVPFGEYVPFESLLRGMISFFNLPMSSFVPGPDNQGLLMAQGFKFSPNICYEIAYPWYVQSMSTNADFILTVSNDAWFGQSIGPAQHLQIAQFRALELGRYLIRSTNTGFTAIVGPKGAIEEIAPQFEPQILKGVVISMSGETFWGKYGPGPFFGLLAVILGLAFFLQSRQKS